MELTFPNGRRLALDPPRIMGILNVTPDSFSDGGRFTAGDAAVAHGMAMVEAGADLVDVGGESTRPGSQPVPPEEQIARVRPVITALVGALEGRGRRRPISIDTTHAVVAEAALAAGAGMINDVSAGRDDPQMFALAAHTQAPLVLMHMQGTPATMQVAPQYDDVVAEVRSFLVERAEAAQAAGVRRERIVLDPGIGFGKTREHNLELLAHLEELTSLGYPVLLGTSRKRFMGTVCQNPDGSAPSPAELVGATCATTVQGIRAGVALFRVHDVQANKQALQVTMALMARHGK